MFNSQNIKNLDIGFIPELSKFRTSTNPLISEEDGKIIENKLQV